MAGRSKVIDTSAVLGVKVFCEDVPAANLDSPLTVEAEFVPGASSGRHVHPRQEESYEVLSGVLDVYMEGRWQRLQAGHQSAFRKERYTPSAIRRTKLHGRGKP